MEEFIIKIDTGKNSSNDTDTKVPIDLVIEPGLLPETRHILPRFQVSGWLAHYPHFLEKKIHRNPRNLLSHVQRILLHHAKKDASATYGALIDLFLVLGQQGGALRKNLLEKTSNLLVEDQRLFLSEHIDSGLKAKHLTSSISGTCLSKGTDGDLAIVNRTDIDELESSSPLMLAREYLRQGNPSTACLLLEGSLENDPGQEDICKELLTLYRDHSMRDAFFKTYSTMIGRQLASAEKWQETEQFFQGLKNNG